MFAGDDLGAVECTGVPLADLPHQLESTRVFSLTLAGNGLRKFPVGKLRDMGELILLVSPTLPCSNQNRTPSFSPTVSIKQLS